jgi:hypothetical protein
LAQLDDGEPNAIQTIVPFFTLATDSRAGSIGYAGAATSPDVYSMHWDPVKFAFIDGKGGMFLSYSPWFRNLVPDINIAQLAGYKRLDNKQRCQVRVYCIRHLEMFPLLMSLEILNVLSTRMNLLLTLLTQGCLLIIIQRKLLSDSFIPTCLEVLILLELRPTREFLYLNNEGSVDLLLFTKATTNAWG